MENGDTLLERVIDEITTKPMTSVKFEWKYSFLQAFQEVIKPLAEKARNQGIKTYGIVGGADRDMIKDFQMTSGFNFPVFTADDILLKTIIRSNPGILLIKDGIIIKKWHYKKLPELEEIRAKYLP